MWVICGKLATWEIRLKSVYVWTVKIVTGSPKKGLNQFLVYEIGDVWTLNDIKLIKNESEGDPIDNLGSIK